jgi:hypothetical protein
MRILVAGGTGSVGRHVCAEVVRTLGPGSLVVGDYDPARGREYARSISGSVDTVELDVHDRGTVDRGTDGVDAVIVAVRQFEPVVQTVCTEKGIPSVDIVPDTPLAASLFSPHEAHPEWERLSGVVAAGLIPGLSGLMARHVIETSPVTDDAPGDRVIHVSLLQRKDGTAGAAGIADMLGLFARPVTYEGRRVRGFSRKRITAFPPPFGERTVRLVAFPEAADVGHAFGLDHVRYWTAFDVESFNRTIGTLNRLGILNRFATPGGGARLARRLASSKAGTVAGDETVALVAEARGSMVRLTVPSDYGGTAMAAVAMTRALLSDGPPDCGVVTPFQLFTLDRILGLIESSELRVEMVRADE